MYSENLIPKFSYSQLSTWDRCHFSWYLNYHEKWATTETKSYFVEGNVGHDLLMIYYKNIPLTDHASCVRLVKQRVSQYHNAAGSDPEKLEIVTKIARVTKRYLEEFAHSDSLKWEFLDAEKHFEIPLLTPKGRQYLLEGYIDVLAREKATGRIWVWDHKFVGRSSSFWSEDMLIMDSQLPTYVGALQSFNVPVFGAVVNMLNKWKYAKPVDDVPENLFKRKQVMHGDQELQSRIAETGKIVDEILEACEAGEFRRSMSKDCSGCFWMDPCLVSIKSPETPIDDVMKMSGVFVKKQPKKALI